MTSVTSPHEHAPFLKFVDDLPDWISGRTAAGTAAAKILINCESSDESTNSISDYNKSNSSNRNNSPDDDDDDDNNRQDSPSFSAVMGQTFSSSSNSSNSSSSVAAHDSFFSSSPTPTAVSATAATISSNRDSAATDSTGTLPSAASAAPSFSFAPSNLHCCNLQPLVSPSVTTATTGVPGNSSNSVASASSAPPPAARADFRSLSSVSLPAHSCSVPLASSSSSSLHSIKPGTRSYSLSSMMFHHPYSSSAASSSLLSLSSSSSTSSLTFASALSTPLPKQEVAKLLPQYKSSKGTVLGDFKDKKVFLFLDYDGTLTPIVSDPSKAFLSANMRSILVNLAQSKQVTVGIVTGRALASVKHFVQIEATENIQFLYAASHGFHIEVAGQQIHHKVGARFIPILREAAFKIACDLREVPGVTLEDNEFSVSVHYRNTPSEYEGQIETTIDDILIFYPCLRKTKGKMVFELRINCPWDKGRAVLWLLQAMKVDPTDSNVRLVYIGDDITDEDAFKILRQLGEGHHQHLPILVADTDLKTRALYNQRLTSAVLTVDDTNEVAEFLSNLYHVTTSTTTAAVAANTTNLLSFSFPDESLSSSSSSSSSLSLQSSSVPSDGDLSFSLSDDST